MGVADTARGVARHSRARSTCEAPPSTRCGPPRGHLGARPSSSYWVDEGRDAGVGHHASGRRPHAAPADQAGASSSAPSPPPSGTPASGAETFNTGPAARAAFRRLHDALVAPLRPWLPARDGLVTIVPHGPLFRLSFAALTDRRGRYLIEDYPDRYAPSVAVLRLVHDRGAREGPPSYLLVGNPALSGRAARSRGLRAAARAAPRGGGHPATRRARPRRPSCAGRSASESVRARGGRRVPASLHLATHAITDDADPFDVVPGTGGRRGGARAATDA